MITCILKRILDQKSNIWWYIDQIKGWVLISNEEPSKHIVSIGNHEKGMKNAFSAPLQWNEMCSFAYGQAGSGDPPTLTVSQILKFPGFFDSFPKQTDGGFQFLWILRISYALFCREILSARFSHFSAMFWPEKLTLFLEGLLNWQWLEKLCWIQLLAGKSLNLSSAHNIRELRK